MICPKCKRSHGLSVELVPSSKLGAMKCTVCNGRFVRHGRRGLRQVSS